MFLRHVVSACLHMPQVLKGEKNITDCGTCGGPLLSKHSSRWWQDMPSPAMAVVAVASNLEKTSFLNWISDASCSIVFLKSCGCLLAKSLWEECASSNPFVFSFQLEVSKALDWSALRRLAWYSKRFRMYLSPSCHEMDRTLPASHFRPTLQTCAHDPFGGMRVTKLSVEKASRVSLAFFSSCRRQRSASSWKERSRR